jgi:hypothetical protein
MYKLMYVVLQTATVLTDIYMCSYVYINIYINILHIPQDHAVYGTYMKAFGGPVRGFNGR